MYICNRLHPMGDKSAHNCCRSISLCAMSGFLGELKKFIQQRCDGADDDVDVDGWILILVKKKNPQFLCCVVWLVCVHFVSRPNYNWSVLWLHGATKAGFAPPFFLSACLSVWFLVLSSPLVQWRRRRRRRWLVESVRCATGAWWWKSLNIDVNNRRTNERTNERFFLRLHQPNSSFCTCAKQLCRLQIQLWCFFGHFGRLLYTLCYHRSVCVWFG